MVDHLGAAGEPLILTVTCGQEVTGIFPLCVDGQCGYFLGIPDVCDYQDAILAPGHEAVAMEQVLAYLSKNGIDRLDLQTIRPDAAILKALTSLEDSGSIKISQ